MPLCLQHSYLTSFARVPPSDKNQHDQPWDRARQRADALLNRHYQQKALQAGADADVAEDETEKFHRGDVAVAAAEGNVVQLGLANMRLEVVEELSDAEEELFASDPQGEGTAIFTSFTACSNLQERQHFRCCGCRAFDGLQAVSLCLLCNERGPLERLVQQLRKD